MQKKAASAAAPATEIEKLTLEAAFKLVQSAPEGLTPEDAATRRRPSKSGRGALWTASFRLVLDQLKNPILLLLGFCAILSGVMGQRADALTILAILAASLVLTHLQERQASQAVQRLINLVASKFMVRRRGSPSSVGIDDVVPGDIVCLQAGGAIPGDGLVLESAGLLVDEAALTGESEPCEKEADSVLFAGTHVQSGSGTMLVVRMGEDTQFGKVAQDLRDVRPESQFKQGLHRYGYVLMEFSLCLTLAIFLINFALHKPVAEAFLFSLALAVGLTPQMLPAIMSATLARGASILGANNVIVKRLEAIEDLGCMNVLCSDKTGTLTEGKTAVVRGFGLDSGPDQEALHLAQMNAAGTKGFENPIDLALRESAESIGAAEDWLVSEIPYDFARRRQSVIVRDGTSYLVITKGAVASVLDVCPNCAREEIEERFKALSNEGLRVLAVSKRHLESSAEPSKGLESNMTYVGLVAFEDPLREDTKEMVSSLKQAGVQLKMLTGDNRHVAAYIAGAIGLRHDNVLCGEELDAMPGPALARQVAEVDVFAEVRPIQKERILLAIRKAGYVAGYIGDGINDAPALHAADVGISVSSAVDVAREAADFVLLERGLSVIEKGIKEGRRIFANTMKYVFITSSANLGNVLSMAAVSVFLPFLPMLPKQILLNNFVTDMPALSIAGDEVDPSLVQKPRRWKIDSIRRFMIVFGLHSSVFDLLTFAILWWGIRASRSVFQTAWFVESALSELIILLVIRTPLSVFKSRPGKPLLIVSLVCAVTVLVLPFIPWSSTLGFSPLPLPVILALSLTLLLYASTAELLKRRVLKGAWQD